MRNLIIIVIGIIVLAVIGAGAYTFLFQETPKTETQTIKKSKKKVSNWNGTGTRKLQTTFIRSGKQITIDKINFSGLNTSAANATVSIMVPAENGNLPGWVTQNSFYFRTTDNLTFKPKVSATVSGSVYTINLQIKKIPTDHLGVTCNNNVQENVLYLIVKGPGKKPFRVGILASEPPAGSCLSEKLAKTAVPVAKEKKKATKKKAVKKKKKSKKKKRR